MPNAEIDVKWMLKWNSGHRRHVGPVVSTAVEMIKIASNQYGFEPTSPKVANIWQVTSTYPSVGESSSATSFDLFFPYRSVRSRKVRELTGLMTVFAFHEFVHCYRAETFTEEDILEYAATEGLAYNAQDIFNRDLLAGGEVPLDGDAMPVFNTRELGRVTTAFYKDLAEQRVDGPSHKTGDPLHAKWFDIMFVGHLAPGEVLGINHVKRHLDRGVPIGELVMWPAEEIIKL